jgi:N-carbamoyl-L-amino-acid hydrolase
LIIGGHLDSVPDGGWLDGCLNVVAGLEVLRRIHAETAGRPPVTVRLVDWADEEGARFGKSLFGSSAFSGNLDLAEARRLRDRDGMELCDALAECGIRLDSVMDAAVERKDAGAYLELHIEQGPVLLDKGLPLGVVLGTCGVERWAVTFTGQAAHSGSTPMDRRRDAFLAAARMAPEIHAIAARHGGVCTIGSCKTFPGIVTSVVAECEITLDQRHLDPAALAAMLAEARSASERFAAEGGTGVRWERIWHIEPVPFDPTLIGFAAEAVL